VARYERSWLHPFSELKKYTDRALTRGTRRDTWRRGRVSEHPVGMQFIASSERRESLRAPTCPGDFHYRSVMVMDHMVLRLNRERNCSADLGADWDVYVLGVLPRPTRLWPRDHWNEDWFDRAKRQSRLPFATARVGGGVYSAHQEWLTDDTAWCRCAALIRVLRKLMRRASSAPMLMQEPHMRWSPISTYDGFVMSAAGCEQRAGAQRAAHPFDEAVLVRLSSSM